jgi:hypothetical protein
MIFAVVAPCRPSGGLQRLQGRDPAVALDGAASPRAKLSSGKCDPHNKAEGPFYSSDAEEPPHVHVERDDNSAKFWLGPVRLENSGGF